MKTYREIYRLVGNYYDIPVDDYSFSNRTISRLRIANISNAQELIEHTPEEMAKIRGFGYKCQKEVEDYIRNLAKKTKNKNLESIEKLPVGIIRKLNKRDFDLKDYYLDEEQTYFVNRVIDAYELLDEDILEACKDNSKIVQSISNCLCDFYKKTTVINKCRNMVDSKYFECKVKYFIFAFLINKEGREQLLEICSDKEETLDKYLYDAQNATGDDVKLLENFFEWCLFDINSEINTLKKYFENKDRELFVLKERATGKTLEQVGEIIGVTRERIRQIERKGFDKFIRWQSRYMLLHKVRAIKNKDIVLTPLEVKECLGDDAEFVIYLYKNNKCEEIIYDKHLNVFLFCDKNEKNKADSYINSLPEMFEQDKLIDYLNKGVEEYDLSKELLDTVLDVEYNITGNVYHKKKLTLTTIYTKIFEERFPDGLHVYDSRDINKFRNAVKEEFDLEITGSDRSIVGILTKVGTLCDRGIYKIDNKELSDELAKKIEEYIDSMDYPAVLTNTIFSVFEEELLNENIDNKYYLQALMRKRFESKWFFRRDYISKDESFTSLYTSIIDFIKKAEHPVTKDEIYIEFPGITEIVINFAVCDKEVINLFGVYIHSSKLSVSLKEKEYLKSRIDVSLEKESIVHCSEIYNYISDDYPELLINNYINYAFGLYSVLEYLFESEYSFSRPLIAKKGERITQSKSIMHDMISEMDEVELETIQDYAKERQIRVYNILDFIDSCNETHLLVSESRLVKIEKIGISKETMIVIDKILEGEIDSTKPIAEINCVNMFPKVNYEWTEWLIYSAVKKWSDKFDVATNNKFFKKSSPLIAKKGEMDTSIYESLSRDEIGSFSIADNMDDIDNLIMDIDFDELGDIR